MSETTEIHFYKMNHFWLDSGLLGLAVILKELKPEIKMIINDAGLTLGGTEDALRDALKRAYDLLIERYYNLSTKKQKEDMSGFFYNSDEKCIKRFARKQLGGIPGLLYGENQIFQYKNGIKWADKKMHRLPEEYIEVQEVLDEFIATSGIKPSIGILLLDGPYEFRPKIGEFHLSKKGKIKKCFLCGQQVYGEVKEITKGTYPFITSSSGFKTFNSFCSSAEQVCWKCDYVSKFAPVNGFYFTNKSKQNEEMFIFFPYSISFEKMLEIYPPLEEAKYNDPYLFRNFQQPFGGDSTLQKPFEVAFVFLYTIYDKLLRLQKAVDGEVQEFWERVIDFAVSRAPVEFVVLHAESKGQTTMGKMVWPFRDSVYFFRLMKEIEESGINIKEVMNLLVDPSLFSKKGRVGGNKTLIRNRVCERILKKQPAIDLIEYHAFHSERTYIYPLLEFVNKFDPMVRKGVEGMTLEEQSVAVTLGKRIGMTVGNNGKKGDLFALRKTRRKADFLNELTRLQFKCELTVPPDVYEGKLTDANFIEFKQFCMLAALNSFYAATHSGKGEKP